MTQRSAATVEIDAGEADINTQFRGSSIGPVQQVNAGVPVLPVLRGTQSQQQQQPQHYSALQLLQMQQMQHQM